MARRRSAGGLPVHQDAVGHGVCEEVGNVSAGREDSLHLGALGGRVEEQVSDGVQ
jgi:hypothetical protein